jgi:hypothetical protein
MNSDYLFVGSKLLPCLLLVFLCLTCLGTPVIEAILFRLYRVTDITLKKEFDFDGVSCETCLVQVVADPNPPAYEISGPQSESL